MRFGAIESGLAAALFGLVALAPLTAANSQAAAMERSSTLIGYGCGETEATEYHDEEDEFTAPCARIQRRDQDEPIVLYVSLEEARTVQGQVYEINGECRVISPAGREGYLEFKPLPCSGVNEVTTP